MRVTAERKGKLGGTGSSMVTDARATASSRLKPSHPIEIASAPVQLAPRLAARKRQRTGTVAVETRQAIAQAAKR
jgi:hypothetical protein